jgi:hypothetical protein
MKKFTILFTGILLSLHGFSQWSLTGNAGTNPATNFVGTTDAQRLVFRTNNTEKMTILSTGQVGINTTTPGTLLHIFSNTADFHFRLSGSGPSVQLVNGSPTGAIISSARFALATGPGYYVATAVNNDVVLANYDSATSILFAVGNASGNGIERARINRFGYMGIAASAPTAKLHVNCTAISGQTNPSNIRFQNLQGGTGKYLVIDSNGYVYSSTTGPAASAVTAAQQTATPLNIDLQSQVEDLKKQVEELRSLILSRQPLSPQQLNTLKNPNLPWLGDGQPNPSNNSTLIEYSLPAGTSIATCQVYSLDGKILSTTVLNPSAGKSRVNVDTGKLAPGMYIYSLIVNGKATDTKKLIVSH